MHSRVYIIIHIYIYIYTSIYIIYIHNYIYIYNYEYVYIDRYSNLSKKHHCPTAQIMSYLLPRMSFMSLTNSDLGG